MDLSEMDQEMMQTSNAGNNTRYCCRLFREGEKSNTLNQSRKFIAALENDDVPTVEQMLSSNEMSFRQEVFRYPVHTLIMRTLSPNIIEMAVRKYPDAYLGRSDRFVELIRCVSEAKHNRSPSYWISTNCTIIHEYYFRAVEIVDLLIKLHRENSSSPVQLMEAVFGKGGDASDDASPFTRACWNGFAIMVTKFLDLITDETREHLRVEWFSRHESLGGCNVFHYADGLPVAVVKAIIDRLPFSRSLLNANRSDSVVGHPLFTLAFRGLPNSASIARLYVLHGGAQVDPLNYCGMTPLLKAIKCGNLEMVEYFLRMGARTNIVDREGSTALSLALRFGDFSAPPNAKNISSTMIEFLLASGVDLGKEACLRTAVPPNPYPKDPHNKSLRELLCDLRDSNTMNSMARLCRKVIRRQMGPNVDEKIKEGMSASELPKHLKSYLLVENEPPVLSGQVGQ